MRIGSGLGAIFAVFLAFAMAQPAAAQTVNLTPTQDATLCEDPASGGGAVQGLLANGRGQHLFAGATLDSTRRRRALVEFDIAGNIPSGSVITNVVLTLNVSRVANATARTVALRRVTADWAEDLSDAAEGTNESNEGQCAPVAGDGATWLERFAASNLAWSSAGGDFVGTNSATASIAGIGNYSFGSTAQMVADVQSWLDNPSGNFGWILIGEETLAQAAKRFDSKDNPTAAVRPQLAVTFTPGSDPAPFPPTGVVASVNPGDATQVNVAWAASATATSYEVHRSLTPSSSDATLVSTTPTTSFADNIGPGGANLQGIVLFYFIKACNGSGCSDFSQFGSLPPQAAPVAVQAGDGLSGLVIRVTWNQVAGADSYEVHRALFGDPNFALLAPTVNLSFDDATAVVGAVFQYKVRACNSGGCGPFSVVDTGQLASQVNPPAIFASLLPASRSVQVGQIASAFVSLVNFGDLSAEGCSIAPLGGLPVNFSFQFTNPGDNSLGPIGLPASIAAKGSQTFLITLTPTGAFNPTQVQFNFDCTNTDPALQQPGVNTMLLASSTTPVPDVVMLAATSRQDGIVNLPGTLGTSVFAVATINVGAAGAVTLAPSSGSPALPITLAICETNPATGACIGPAGPAVATTVGAGAASTFAIFATGRNNVAFDPANNRITVSVLDTGNAIRGQTSVAVSTGNTLTVTPLGEANGGTISSVNIPGISCPPDCTETYLINQTVILQGVPTSGQLTNFDGFGGACTGTSCTVIMSSDQIVTGTFSSRDPGR